ncbi:MAG: glycosyltransferase [bacterium]
MKISDSLIVVTPQLKNYYENITSRSDIYVIPNAANTDKFKPCLSLNNDISKPYVLFFGALARWQGINLILNAIKCKDWPEDVLLVIAGDGIEKDKVVKESENDKRIIYLGNVLYNNMPNLISNCLVALSPQNNLGEDLRLVYHLLKYMRLLLVEDLSLLQTTHLYQIW